jgi:hypothetical protein
MSSLVIAGDTSGSVTLQAPAVSGATVLTLPATSGTVITTASGTASSATTATNIAGGVAGAIPYQSGSGATGFSAAGTAGQVLQSNGTSAPTWITPSAGALVLLSTVTASSSATVDVESTFNSTYDNYMIAIAGLTVSVDNTALFIQLKIGGTYLSSGYYYGAVVIYDSVGSYVANRGTNSGQITATDGNVLKNQASASLSGNVWLSNPTSTAFSKAIRWHLNNSYSTSNQAMIGGGMNAGTSALTGVRFRGDTGNIVAGTFRLYGIVNS